MSEKNNHKKSEENSVEQNLSDNYVPKNKLGNLPMSNNVDEQLKKQMDKTKSEIEKFKKEITKKFKFVESIGIMPAQASKKIEEEFEISEEDSKKKLIHILCVIPESKFKEINKIRLEAIRIAKSINEKLWIHMMTPVDVWNLCLDSKFDIVEALAMSYPVLDKGLLGALRVSTIHKSLVLKKFEKYVTTYGIYGSLTRGEATSTSDVDVAIIIDDTDVKRMNRLELKEKLRGIVYSYIQEATAIAGVKNILNVQVWLLTEFWDGVKDAHPVFFTFLRDGVPFYDRGTFLPWKSLLKMGKIKPSPEAIDMFMSSGDKLKDNVERRLLDIAVMDLYWGTLTPTQGLLMLYGLAPPTPKETVKLVKETLYKKEKLMEKKYVDILEEIVSFYKGYEHGKNKKISGTELDKMIKNAYEYIERLKELRKQIEKRVQQKSIEDAYNDVFGMLESILDKKSESAIIKNFDEKLVKQGHFPERFTKALKNIAKVKKDLANKTKKKNENTFKEIDKARKMASELTNALIEYHQRCDFLSMERTRFIAKTKEKIYEVFFLKDTFVVDGPRILKLKDKELKKADSEELRKQLTNAQKGQTKIDLTALEELKKIIGDFDLVY